MKHFILVLFSLLALTVSVAAQEQKNDSLPATDLERVRVGVEAPDFTLTDQDGQPVKLSQFRGKKTVVLVFYRGYWWPYCAAQLGKLKSLLDEKYKDQVEILAVSVDPRDRTLALREKLKGQPGADYAMLSDPDHKVIDRYGLLNDKAKRPLPHPATYVIDRKGIVRWRFIEVDYTKRPANEDVLKEIEKIEAGKSARR